MLLIHKKASQLDKRLSCVSIQKDSEVSSTGPWTSTETVTDACEQHKDSRLANAGRARGWRQTWMPTKSRRLWRASSSCTTCWCARAWRRHAL